MPWLRSCEYCLNFSDLLVSETSGWRKIWMSRLQFFKSIFNKGIYVYRNFTPWKDTNKKVQQTCFTPETDYKFVRWGGQCIGGCSLESRRHSTLSYINLLPNTEERKPLLSPQLPRLVTWSRYVDIVILHYYFVLNDVLYFM